MCIPTGRSCPVAARGLSRPPFLHTLFLCCLALSLQHAACLPCRSVYITKQVSFRNRVLILFDWLKAQVFGRDLSNY